MFSIASQALSLNETSAGAKIARVVALRGFGGRRSDEAVLVIDGVVTGSLLGGSADAQILGAAAAVGAAGHTAGAHGAASGGATVLDVAIADDAAVGCGLACGGRATVMVQPISQIPLLAWRTLVAREPVVVATLVGGEDVGRSIAVTLDGTLDGSLGDPSVTVEAVHACRSLLDRAKDLSATVMTEAGPLLVTLLRPPALLLVVGEAALANAIAAQGALLGWSTAIVAEAVGAEAIAAQSGSLGSGDALVVLSHDLPVSCAAIAAALGGRCGYVGALGSRHTQTARADVLRTSGVPDEALGRVHGPVGLDLGSRTPEETALAIAAEIVATLSGRTAASLRGHTGPING